MRFKEYLKFRKIFKHFISRGNIPFASNEINLKTSDLYYLQAKGIIKITPYQAGDDNCRISIPDKGLTYRDDVLVAFLHFFVPTAISIAALIVSIVKN